MPSILPFNFDHMAQLAQTDPAAFEAQRRAMLEGALDFAPRGHEDWARERVADVQRRGAAAAEQARQDSAAAWRAMDDIIDWARSVAKL